ncbi:MAG: MscL family protein [Deltaproteobacteria bacterium]|nr:MscL family protein [Deltaproteobacteria bacterium]
MTVNYGLFINAIISFLIVAFEVFMLARGINRLKSERPAEATTKQCPCSLSTMAIKASRCPQCTSELTPA